MQLLSLAIMHAHRGRIKRNDCEGRCLAGAAALKNVLLQLVERKTLHVDRLKFLSLLLLLLLLRQQ